MGIIAYCPTGHRIKVKDHLAGRKGICPTCGGKFRIPHASMPEPAHARPAATRATGERAALADATMEAGLPIATIVSLDSAAAVGLPRLLVLDDSTGGDARAADAAPLVDPDPTADVAVETDADEPGDAAELFWYVAIPGGQPSAAMRDPEMTAWLASGRITGREVVWRSDWPDWRPIGEAFPEHGPGAVPRAGGW